MATQPLSAELGGELFDIDCMRAGLLGDSDLKEYGAGRMVRKSSEKQARRLIDVAAGSWESFELSGQPQDAGVFVGFDVVDCDDGAEACFSFGGKVADYAERMLTDTKPLNGLTLLNSTAISHIAELLNITGVSGGFSASADAGLQALVEAAYNVAERRCRHALVIGGGAKITPWYLLRHREQLSPWRNRGIHPLESASAVLISSDLAAAQGELLAWRRNFASGEKPWPNFRSWASIWPWMILAPAIPVSRI